MQPLKNWNKHPRKYTFGEPTFYNDFHRGLDIAAPYDTPIYAPFDGVVSAIDEDDAPQGGNMIYFESEQKQLVVRFLHLSSFENTGRVEEGDIIGYVGNTGLGTGTHVHIDICKMPFDLYDLDKFIDPEKYFEVPGKASFEPRELTMTVIWNNQEIDKTITSQVAKWYKDKLNLTIKFKHKKTDFNQNKIAWYSKGDYQSIKRKWVKHNLCPIAKDSDMLSFMLTPEDWMSSSLGFMFNDKQLGIIPCFQKVDREEKRFENDIDNWGHSQPEGTLHHEIMHALYNMMPGEIKDETHLNDYKLDSPELIAEDIVPAKLQGFPNNAVFRVLKEHSERTQKIKYWTPNNNYLYRDRSNSVFLFYKNNDWKLIGESQFNKLQSDADQIVIIPRAQANYIAKQEGLELDNPPRTIIMRKVRPDLYDEIKNNPDWGWSTEIPDFE